jgi:hypothetical protein
MGSFILGLHMSFPRACMFELIGRITLVRLHSHILLIRDLVLIFPMLQARYEILALQAQPSNFLFRNFQKEPQRVLLHSVDCKQLAEQLHHTQNNNTDADDQSHRKEHKRIVLPVFQLCQEIITAQHQRLVEFIEHVVIQKVDVDVIRSD